MGSFIKPENSLEAPCLHIVPGSGPDGVLEGGVGQLSAQWGRNLRSKAKSKFEPIS